MNKRTLPRNVDGRIKIGPFTVKNFLKWLGIPLVIAYFFLKNPSQPTFIFSIFMILFSSIPFMEINNKQTGVDFIKEIILYDIRTILADFFPNLIKNKEIYFERSEFDVTILEKFTFNEKVHNLKRSKKESD